MKFKKLVAAALVLSMIAGVAGCSKVKAISGEDFVSACENLGATEVDPDDNDVEEDALEDGIYMVMDSDCIQDSLSSSELTSGVSMYGLSTPDINSIVDAEDIEEATAYVRLSQNFDDLDSMDEIGDADLNMVMAMQITLTDADMVEDIMDGIADSLDEYCGIDVEDLSSNEYYAGKNEGYAKIHIDVQNLYEAFLDSDTYSLLAAFGGDLSELEDSLSDVSGGIDTAVYINGENMVVIIGINVNDDPTYLNDVCSELKLADPSSLPANEEAAQGLVDYIDDTIGQLMSGMGAMSYDY